MRSQGEISKNKFCLILGDKHMCHLLPRTGECNIRVQSGFSTKCVGLKPSNEQCISEHKRANQSRNGLTRKDLMTLEIKQIISSQNQAQDTNVKEPKGMDKYSAYFVPNNLIGLPQQQTS